MSELLCLRLEPGVVDFPARCRRNRGHDGPHRCHPWHTVGPYEWEDENQDD